MKPILLGILNVLSSPHEKSGDLSSKLELSPLPNPP